MSSLVPYFAPWDASKTHLATGMSRAHTVTGWWPNTVVEAGPLTVSTLCGVTVHERSIVYTHEESKVTCAECNARIARRVGVDIDEAFR